MMIDYSTKLIALLGNPLSQTLSPQMQNAAYQAMGVNYAYIPVEVDEEGFAAVLNAIRYMNFAGFAITKPYKVSVMKYLDELDESARAIGSCNTVVIRDGRFIGYNTDGIGCVHSLREQAQLDVAGKTFFVYGAGGAGMAVCYELASHGASHIYIVDVNDRCEALAKRINGCYSGVCTPIDINDKERIAGIQPDTDVVMNLTGLGMRPHEDRTPADPALFKSRQFCYDAIYNAPDRSRFLLDAEKAGCRTLNGLGMLLYQAVEQIRLWTGLLAPVDVMQDVIKLNTRA